MNELYEMTLESQYLQLLVIEHLVILSIIHMGHSYINSFTF